MVAKRIEHTHHRCGRVRGGGLFLVILLVIVIFSLYFLTTSCRGNKLSGPVFLHLSRGELAGPDGSGTSPDGSSEQTLIMVGIKDGIQELPDVPFDEEPPQLPDNREEFLSHPVVIGLEELGFELVNAFPEIWAGLFALAPGWTLERAIDELPKLFPEIEYIEPDVELDGAFGGAETKSSSIP